MKKNKMKLITIIMMTIALCMILYSAVFATNTILGDNANVNPNLGNDTAISGRVNIVLSYVQYIGYAIAVGMLLYIGIKYMMSAANERAELKKGAINWIIGAIMVAGVTGILTAIVSIGSGMNEGNTPSQATAQSGLPARP